MWILLPHSAVFICSFLNIFSFQTFFYHYTDRFNLIGWFQPYIDFSYVPCNQRHNISHNMLNRTLHIVHFHKSIIALNQISWQTFILSDYVHGNPADSHQMRLYNTYVYTLFRTVVFFSVLDSKWMESSIGLN